jgi:hypothetical protein
MRKSHFPIIFVLSLAVGFPVYAGNELPPAESEMAKSRLSTVVVGQLNKTGSGANGYHMASVVATSMEAAALPEGVDVGLKFTSEAQPGGGKGDYTVANSLAQNFKMIGGWFYISPDSSVQQIGLQFQESSREYFCATSPGEFTGWKWLEWDRADLKPMLKQKGDSPENDQVLELPIIRVSVIWMVKNDSPTVVGVAGLTATME